MAVPVIAEPDNALLIVAIRHSVTVGAQCEDEIHAMIAGYHCGGTAEAAGKFSGIANVMVVDAVQFAAGLAENIATQALALARMYIHILASATAYGKNIAPRAASLLDVSQILEITRVNSHATSKQAI